MKVNWRDPSLKCLHTTSKQNKASFEWNEQKCSMHTNQLWCACVCVCLCVTFHWDIGTSAPEPKNSKEPLPIPKNTSLIVVTHLHTPPHCRMISEWQERNQRTHQSRPSTTFGETLEIFQPNVTPHPLSPLLIWVFPLELTKKNYFPNWCHSVCKTRLFCFVSLVVGQHHHTLDRATSVMVSEWIGDSGLMNPTNTTIRLIITLTCNR